MPKLLDLKGQRFGRLVVLERAKENINNRPAQICQCDCGNIKIISGNLLRTKQTQSCGCLMREKNKILHKKEIPIGSHQNHQTVLKENGQDPYGNFLYQCKCDCGTIKDIKGTSLRQGVSTSCGKCLRNNIIGKKYGLLTILSINEEKTNDKNLYVNCICECGNKTIVAYNNLTRQNQASQKSCGCLKKSYGEYIVNKILSQYKIPFEEQKTFETCRFEDTNQLAFFDFYVDNKYIIEVDGQQHFYKSCEYYEGQFEKTRNHDLYKNKQCRENNIPIIRIPFNKIENITIKDLLLDSSNYLLKGDDEYFSQF